MLDWLKYFSLNFFNKNYASQSKNRSLWNGVLAFILAVALLYLTLCGMATASFPTHYNKSTQFQTYLHGLFSGDNAISLTINNGIATYTDSADIRVINSFTNDADQAYANDTYNVIVDMRDNRALYNDCNVTFVNKSDTNDVITYETYQDLTQAKRDEYSPKLNLTPNCVTLNAEFIASCAEDIVNSGSEESKQSLQELKTDDTIPQQNYGKVYELYFQTKYGALGNGFTTAPTMRDYYLNTYLATDANGNGVYQNYVILLQDVAFSVWYTDDGQLMSISGYYAKDNLIVNSAQTADQLFKGVNNANTEALRINYFLYIVRMALTLCFVWLLLPMLVSVIGFFLKNNLLADYSAMAKTMGGFWLGSVIPAILFVIIASFYLSQTYVFYLSIAVLLITNGLRTTIHYVQILSDQKAKQAQAQAESPTQE